MILYLTDTPPRFRKDSKLHDTDSGDSWFRCHCYKMATSSSQQRYVYRLHQNLLDFRILEAFLMSHKACI